jgi:GST-like protein
MYTLYGSPGSGSAAVEVALDWAGLPWQGVRAATWEPDSALQELAALNPLQQIPTLKLPDGSVLSESAAILIHLGLLVPACGLLPTDPGRRAQALRGLVYIAANCYSAVSISDFPERWCSPADEACVASVRAGARAQLHRHWDWFADLFPGQPFLLGEAPCALDLLAAVVSKWSGTRAHLARHRPGLLATLKRIEQHPRMQPVLSRHWPRA